MYFKSTFRQNPKTGQWSGYYRLVESYRNFTDRICHRTILNIGFLDHLEAEQLNGIQKELTLRADGKVSLFSPEDPLVAKHVALFWARIISEKRVDVSIAGQEKKRKLIDTDTMEHRNVREVGTEWLCHQALEQLEIKQFLQQLGWDQEQIALALTQIISRAAYPASEYRTTRWILENSAVSELTGYPLHRLTKDKLYKGSLALFDIKDKLEQHLSVRTNELFDIEDNIVLYDLTNVYFEGTKDNSKLANYGRSKEKRSDAKLVVLALVVNPQGFLKYSSVIEGNKSDSSSLPDIIDGLHQQTAFGDQKPTVVMDAGIATKDNLALIVEKGYKYICISRSKLKNYQEVEGSCPQTLLTNNKQTLTLQRVKVEGKTDYYLKVNSPGKQLKESSMKQQFEGRLEAELQKVSAALTRKGGIKKEEKVNRRLGRIIQKYPSVSQYYSLTLNTDKGIATSLTWDKQTPKHEAIEQHLGVYFIQTNIPIEQEAHLWQTYNTIRNIESTFRCLKSDLDLRPIYHKNDSSTMAHLHLGILAYWIVNTIRYQLRAKEISHEWKEIVRIADTQKVITTTGQNQFGDCIAIRKCSEPNTPLMKIYEALGYKSHPFTRRKSVVHKTELEKNKSHNTPTSPPG